MQVELRHLTEHITQHHIAGLNIEGVLPARQARVWANLVMVLDNPITGRGFDALDVEQRGHGWPTLEATVPEIDETHQLTLYRAIVLYYLQRYSQVGVHVHLFPHNSSYFIRFLQTQLSEPQLARTSFFTDTPMWSSTSVCYDGLDCVVSLSQCAGIDTRLEPGTYFAPRTSLPFDVHTGVIALNQAEVADNALCSDWEDIVATWDGVCAAPVRHNAKKVVPAPPRALALTDIHTDMHGKGMAVLRVNDIWVPKSDRDILTLMN